MWMGDELQLAVACDGLFVMSELMHVMCAEVTTGDRPRRTPEPPPERTADRRRREWRRSIVVYAAQVGPGCLINCIDASVSWSLARPENQRPVILIPLGDTVTRCVRTTKEGEGSKLPIWLFHVMTK